MPLLHRLFVVILVALASAPTAAAEDVLRVEPVAEGVWAIVGPTVQRSPENLGNNATFGLIETDSGAILVDSGGSTRGAQQLMTAIRSVTDHPVTHVINTGGQDHRWLGNGWFQDQGATLIASAAAVADQQERADAQFQRLRALIGEANLAGTEAVTAPEPFTDATTLDIDGRHLELRRVGPAHTPGDTYVWLPEAQVVFSGDVIYHDRMLGVGSQSDNQHWLDAFDAIAALEPAVVVPGHGRPGPLSQSQAETRDYLAHLRDHIGAVIDQGGDMMDAAAVDQSAFSHLKVSEQIGGSNAQEVFSQMEWE